MELRTMGPFISCSGCKESLKLSSQEIFDTYFDRKKIVCGACIAEIDLWETTIATIRENFMFNGALDLVDAKSTKLQVVMEPGQDYVINLDQYSIPQDATIYDINYSPQGIGVTPIEMHGATPQRHKVPRIVRVYARPLSLAGQGPQTVEVIVSAKWIPHAGSNVPLQYLVEAFVGYCQKDYKSMILSAHLAIEQQLSEMIRVFMNKVVPNEKPVIPEYARQLKFILPFLVRLQKLPELDKKIVHLLNELREARNKCSHPWEAGYVVNREQASSFLTAALFGYHYLQRLGPSLMASWPS